MVELNDLLDMSLREVTNTLLEETCKRQKTYCKVKFPGHTQDGDKVMLTLEVKYE